MTEQLMEDDVTDSPENASRAQYKPQATSQQAHEIAIDESELFAAYANFCRVLNSPEELILDLGLNPTPHAAGKVNVKLTQRIIMNHFTAKRVLNALSIAVQRHEKSFGAIETDVRNRVVNDEQ